MCLADERRQCIEIPQNTRKSLAGRSQQIPALHLQAQFLQHRPVSKTLRLQSITLLNLCEYLCLISLCRFQIFRYQFQTSQYQFQIFRCQFLTFQLSNETFSLSCFLCFMVSPLVPTDTYCKLTGSLRFFLEFFEQVFPFFNLLTN